MHLKYWRYPQPASKTAAQRQLLKMIVQCICRRQMSVAYSSNRQKLPVLNKLPFHIVRSDYYHIRIRHSFRSIRSCAYIIHIRNINNDSLNMRQRLEYLQKKYKTILAEYSLSMRPFALSDRFQTSGKFVQYRKFLPITTICHTHLPATDTLYNHFQQLRFSCQ